MNPAPPASALPIFPLAGLRRRLASLLYEVLLWLALVFIAGYLVVGLLPQAPTGLAKGVFQAWLLVVSGLYFTWFWRHGGQTLAMKTWGIRLVSVDGRPLTWRQAWLRFAWACFSVITLAGLVWALFDRERQFLHDRMAGTCVRMTL